MRIFLILISSVALIAIGVRACHKSEIRRMDVESLASDKINSSAYPWSISPRFITKVTNYREAYDIDSNDWIAQFFLKPGESVALSTTLTPIPVSEKKYRCNASIAHWSIKDDLCNFDAMTQAGFIGYFYNPSFCEAGCKQNIILWINEVTGESYIVGSPDYD